METLKIIVSAGVVLAYFIYIFVRYVVMPARRALHKEESKYDMRTKNPPPPPNSKNP